MIRLFRPTSLAYRHSLPVAALATALLGFAQNSGIDETAAAAFAKNDCAAAAALRGQQRERAAASNNWEAAALFGRRLGICYYRKGELESAATAYREGLDAAARSSNEELQLENVHGLALALMHLGDVNEALEFAIREKELANRCQHLMHRERALLQLSMVDQRLGKLASAQAALEEMLRLGQEGKDLDGVGRAMEALAVLRVELGDFAEAVRLERQLIALFPNPLPQDRARTYLNLGAAQKSAGNLNEAEKSLEIARALLPSSENWQLKYSVFGELGKLRMLQKRYDSAERSIRDALAAAAETKNRAAIAEIQSDLAECLLHEGRLPGSLEVVTAAVETSRRIDSPPRLIRALSVLGDVRRAQGNAEAAITALEEAANLVETLRISAPGDPQSLASVLANSKPVYQSLIQVLLEQKQVDRALYWVERSKARVLNDILLRGGVHELSTMTAGERSRERGLYRALFHSEPGSRQAVETSQQLDAFRRRLYTAHPELALQRADFAPTGLKEWQGLLADRRSAMLEFYVLNEGSALFVIRKSGVAWFPLKLGEKTLESGIRRFRQRLASRDVTERMLARELEASLLGAAARTALQGTTNWIVSPDGPLWEVPFETLVDASGKRLLETHAITYTPSFTALMAIRARMAPPHRADLDLFAFADSSIPGAEKEIRDIAALYPSTRTVVLGSKHGEGVESFLREAPRADVVHVASHAEFNPVSPFYSSIRFGAGGGLTAAELVRLPFKARIVILSSCETARTFNGPIGEHEGLMGMGWALTGAGARSSVLSHWKVDSFATAKLMAGFHSELQKAASPAQALRTAALLTMKDPRYSHPYYWAAFAVFGDGLP